LLEWEPTIHNLFEKIVSGIPETFRASVQPLLFETAEKKCRERNSGLVNEADLITALLEITPAAFKPTAIDNLKTLGVDVQRYVDLTSIQDQYRLSWEKFGKAFLPGNAHLAMYVTDRCNQSCLHCATYRNEKQYRPELSTHQWKQIVENIESSLQKHGRHGVYVWFGGEPTCREDIRELIKFCGDRAYLQALITNGVLFDEDFARFCANNGMSHIFVSIDSADRAKSDKIRGFPRSLEYAEKAVKNGLKYGLFVCGSTTVMKQNINELDEIEALCKKWGAEPFFRPVVKQNRAASNWGEIGLSMEEYKRLYDFKYKRTIETIRKGKSGTLPAYAIFEMTPFMEQPLNDKELTALEWGVGCQACRVFNGVDVNGDVFPCGYPSNLILGNVLTQSYEEILDSQLYKDIRDKKRTGKCASCHHLKLCGGGCRVHAESETGDFFSSFSHCWHENDHEYIQPSGNEDLRSEQLKNVEQTLEWKPEIQKLFDRIVSQIPEQFRAHVKPLLRDSAEKECKKRSGLEVSKEDLITALFEITPVTFRPRAIEDLKNLGFETDDLKRKYIHATDIDQLFTDIVKAAEVADVPYNRNVIQEVLTAYKGSFSSAPVTFRTSTKPKERRGLAVRYVQVPGPDSDPYPIALAKGFIKRQGHPIDDLLSDIHTKFPIIGYGIDLDAAEGLTKIWAFLENLSPMEEAYKLPSLPSGVRKHAEYFAKYNLGIFSLFAVDFSRRTVNIYFMLNKPGIFSESQIAGMFGDLGFKIPTKEILNYCSNAFTLYYTFSWDSDRVERICFGIAASDPTRVPTHLDPVIERYVAQAPILSANRRFIFSVTEGLNENYIKIESDYTGSMIELLTFGAHAADNLSGKRSLSETNDLSESAEWQAYLTRFMKALNALPELTPLLKAVAPVLFQYYITDRPEMSYWQLLETDTIRWGMGEKTDCNVPKVIHKTTFAVMKKVNAGELDPVSATMTGQYTVEGDLAKLVACAPLLPLNPKAHASASSSS
jgi:radical SAM protein with 4Fe4S-binding SPASM domain